MSREHRATLAALLLTALLVGCTGTGEDPTGTGSAEAGSSAPEVSSATSESPSLAPVDERGVLTPDAVGEVAPHWLSSTFVGDVQGLPGNSYGDDCLDSAWDVLSLFERLLPVSSTFQADSGTPASLIIAVLEMTTSDQERDLAALDHQLTECVGEHTDGEVLQQAAPAVDGWSGLQIVSEDRDVYWVPFQEGIAIVELRPGLADLRTDLAGEVEAILALQMEELS